MAPEASQGPATVSTARGGVILAEPIRRLMISERLHGSSAPHADPYTLVANVGRSAADRE
jgi:hypothetical protein